MHIQQFHFITRSFISFSLPLSQVYLCQFLSNSLPCFFVVFFFRGVIISSLSLCLSPLLSNIVFYIRCQLSVMSTSNFRDRTAQSLVMCVWILLNESFLVVVYWCLYLERYSSVFSKNTILFFFVSVGCCFIRVFRQYTMYIAYIYIK